MNQNAHIAVYYRNRLDLFVRGLRFNNADHIEILIHETSCKLFYYRWVASKIK